MTTQQDQFDEQNENKIIKELVKSADAEEVFHKVQMINCEVGFENSYPDEEETEKPMINESEWIKKLTLEELDNEEARRGLGEWIIQHGEEALMSDPELKPIVEMYNAYLANRLDLQLEPLEQDVSFNI